MNPLNRWMVSKEVHMVLKYKRKDRYLKLLRGKRQQDYHSFMNKAFFIHKY